MEIEVWHTRRVRLCFALIGLFIVVVPFFLWQETVVIQFSSQTLSDVVAKNNVETTSAEDINKTLTAQTFMNDSAINRNDSSSVPPSLIGTTWNQTKLTGLEVKQDNTTSSSSSNHTPATDAPSSVATTWNQTNILKAKQNITTSSINVSKTQSVINDNTVLNQATDHNISSSSSIHTSVNPSGINSTPYFKLWNYETNTISILNKDPQAPLTSLELLQQILEDNDVGNIKDPSTPLPSCLVPNVEQTQALVDRTEDLLSALPVFNLGMPKCGSSTLKDFFNCAGLTASHRQNGDCMENAVLKGKPPISGCTTTKNPDFKAFCQIDKSFGNKN